MDDGEAHNQNEAGKVKPRNEKIRGYVYMSLLVTMWGLDYVFAKKALDTLDPLCLLFYKYIVALGLMLAIKYKFDKGKFFQKKDIGVFAVCAIFGEILYFFGEYSALYYMPISLVTIILAFVPVVSILIEAILYKRRANKKIIIGIFICIGGVALIIGFDFRLLFQGRIIGYLLAFSCVLTWNVYNFITASLHARYTSITLTVNQLICTCILLFPYAIFNSPSISVFTPDLMGGILYLGLLSSGLGFLIQVKSLHILGPTTTALFSNFLPVTATFFGWLFLSETVASLQLVGGIIVLCAGYAVIKEKGKMEDMGSGGEKSQSNDVD